MANGEITISIKDIEEFNNLLQENSQLKEKIDDALSFIEQQTWCIDAELSIEELIKILEGDSNE